MFNVAVINIKSILKYLVSIIVTFCLVMLITRYFSGLEKDQKNKLSINETFNEKIMEVMHTSMLICLDETVPGLKETNHELNNVDEDKIDKNNILGELLKIELAMFKQEEKIAYVAPENLEQGLVANNAADDNEGKQENIIPPNVSVNGEEVQVVTENPLADNYNIECEGVKIKNETGFELTQEMLSQTIEVNKNIVIFHTHTCESYTSSEAYPYTPTGNYRTTDNNFSVVKVGTELTKYLQSYGYNTIHDTTYHDYPAYTGSYNRSLKTVENILETNPSDIIIDLHRDAIGSREDYSPTVKIGEDYAAQLMFVIGTNGGGLWHPNWMQNLQFAVQVQKKANELYPGLFKPMILRNSRYNQHLGKAACIIEVGATGNTLEQSINSAKYLSAVLNEVLK